TFVSASAGGRLAGNQVEWSVGALAPGESKTVEVELRAAAKGRVCNRAVATAARGLTAQDEACTEFTGEAGGLFAVVDTDDPVVVGGSTSYVITVRNQGMIPVTNVVVTATVPEQMALTQAVGPTTSHQDRQQVRFEPATVQPGAEARYQINVRADQP